MNAVKSQALETLDRLHEGNAIDYNDYITLFDGLTEFEPMQDRDKGLEALWDQFANVPTDPETDCITAPFLNWGAGVHREEIWHWFDVRHSRGVHYLLYGGSDGVEDAELRRWHDLCIECESIDCAYNKEGWCRFPMVYERAPKITEEDGCLEGVIKNI